jgi:hypothetical protein
MDFTNSPCLFGDSFIHSFILCATITIDRIDDVLQKSHTGCCIWHLHRCDVVAAKLCTRGWTAYAAF